MVPKECLALCTNTVIGVQSSMLDIQDVIQASIKAESFITHTLYKSWSE
ncbi:hypothetical protein GCM10008932_13550 [Alkalibacterium iburiense]|uniref:Uncharacterized protein n=1 Tax=Alkalibacterium iburiense TaxID=290589 RepID=A0ABN0XF95_9LACT